MRLGLIGLGRIGAFHARTLAELAVVDSLVVTDAAPGRTATVAAEVGAEVADSPEKLLASGVDGVLIAAATDAHPAMLRAAVDAGVPVFCEKPLASGLTDARAVAAAVRGARVQIGYPRRFDPAFQAVRAAVEHGVLGRVHTVRSTTLDPAPPPRAYLAGSGGLFRDCTVHDLDAVRWVTGVAAGLDVGVPLHPMGPGALTPAGPPHSFFMDRLAVAFRAELATFTEFVAGTIPSPCTVDDALEVARLAEASVTSLREHRPVRLNEIP